MTEFSELKAELDGFMMMTITLSPFWAAPLDMS